MLLPPIGQNTIDQEDLDFRAYLTSNGYDTSKMGLDGVSISDSEVGVGHEEKVKSDA